MKLTGRIFVMSLIALLPVTSYAFDCGSIGSMNRAQRTRLMQEQPEQVERCRLFSDPAPELLPRGRRMPDAPGTSGNLIQGRRAPEETPDTTGAAPSVSNGAWQRSLSLPPWQGFPCQLPGGISVCGGGSGGGSGGASGGGASGGGASSGGAVGGAGCPVRDDTTGVFGQKIPVQGTSTQALTCGGTVSLGTTQYSIVPGANRVAIIDAGQYSMNLYALRDVAVPNENGTTSTVRRFELEATQPLPTQLCMPAGAAGAMQKSVDLRAPMAQIFAYTSSTPRLVVRLTPDSNNPAFDPFAPIPTAPPEKFLIVPLVNGMPQDLVTNCAKETDHYIANPPATADIDIFPVAIQNCDVNTLYPRHASCPNKMLAVVTDDPQLVHEPAVTATFMPISDKPYSMAFTTKDSMLMMQNQSVIRIGASGLKFTLPNGGVLPLKDGTFLRMGNGAEINGTSRSVLLKGGGKIEDAAGTEKSAFNANTTVTPNADLPYYIRVEKRVTLPEGLMVPTKANGSIRLPVDQ
ncbi:MAG: hypothetical protein J0M34_01550 [Alphaproteobacteria bacterium]|nr:hypothetical protein [Alphaproteobacteria bacterium]